MNESGHKIIASHGDQGMMGEKLGMALLVPEDQFLDSWKASDEGEGIVETHMVALSLEKDHPAEYAFFSGWEHQHEGFKTKDFFENQIKFAARKIYSEKQ